MTNSLQCFVKYKRIDTPKKSNQAGHDIIEATGYGDIKVKSVLKK
jgi:hypothetical protein